MISCLQFPDHLNSLTVFNVSGATTRPLKFNLLTTSLKARIKNVHNIILPISQRWDGDGKGGDSLIEVFLKSGSDTI
ncbi:MAG: hypothetical protein IPN18_15440 [Ignavibacteriales bacterium]|nr:hypothetical protein [Ignavibacteriales bacterium]